MAISETPRSVSEQQIEALGKLDNIVSTIHGLQSHLLQAEGKTTKHPFTFSDGTSGNYYIDGGFVNSVKGIAFSLYYELRQQGQGDYAREVLTGQGIKLLDEPAKQFDIQIEEIKTPVQTNQTVIFDVNTEKKLQFVKWAAKNKRGWYEGTIRTNVSGAQDTETQQPNNS